MRKENVLVVDNERRISAMGQFLDGLNHRLSFFLLSWCFSGISSTHKTKNKKNLESQQYGAIGTSAKKELRT